MLKSSTKTDEQKQNLNRKLLFSSIYRGHEHLKKLVV